MRIAALLITMMTCAALAVAQGPLDYQQGFFALGKDTLRYRIMMPMHIKAKAKVPVIIVLHGSGERGSDNNLQLTHGGKMFATPAARRGFPAIIIFPQCPAGETWARTARDQDRGDSLGGLRFRSELAPTTSMKLLMAMLDSLVQQPVVDRDRIYIGGLSMGGMGTFELLWRKPGFFAAAFPICGGGDPDKVSAYTDVPLWIFHGQADPVVKVGNSRRMVNALRAAGAQVQYSEYEGVEHNSWDNAFGEPGLLKWLFQHSRKRS